MRRTVLAPLLVCAATWPVAAQQSPSAADQPEGRNAQAQRVTVEMKDSEGRSVGTVEVRQLAHGVLFVADLRNLPPGPRGFHVHERGACDPPDFQTAGDHYDPQGKEHGFDSPGGPHAGDLPNIYVHDDGTARAEIHSLLLSLEPRDERMATAATGAGDATAGPGPADGGPFPLLGGDGTAIVVHEHADDHRSTDSAGGRIACGVIER